MNMARGKTLVYLFYLFATINILFAQEGSGQSEIRPPHGGNEHGFPGGREAGFNFPFFQGGFGSSMLPDFGSLLSSFTNSNNSGGVPNIFGDSSGLGGLPNVFNGFREEQADGEQLGEDIPEFEEDNEENEGVPQNKFFFGRLIACNYTAQPGSTCSSCRTSLTCFRSNVGKVKICKKLFPYCNNGRCSIFPGSACSAATTVAATDSTTEAGTTV